MKSEVANWVLKKPAPDQRTLIEDSITHSVKAYPAMLAGEMDKATLLIHTVKPPRPKPPRPPELGAATITPPAAAKQPDAAS